MKKKIHEPMFETIRLIDLPGKLSPSRENPRMKAAIADADNDPERAVVYFDGKDNKKAASHRCCVVRWLNKKGLHNKYNVAARNGNVYLWKA